MKLGYFEVRKTSTTEVVRKINLMLEERGTDASSIVSIITTSDWWTILFKEEGRQSKVVKVKDLKVDDTVVNDHGRQCKVSRIAGRNDKLIVIEFADETSGSYHPESEMRILV